MLEDNNVIQAITLLEKAIELLNKAIQGVPTEHYTLDTIEKYISGSGNITWRCTIEDFPEDTVYFRQSQKKMLVDKGIWDSINELKLNETFACKIQVETVEDGDFLKVVSIGNWSVTNVRGEYPF